MDDKVDNQSDDEEESIEELFDLLVDLSPEETARRLGELRVDPETRSCLEQMLNADRAMRNPIEFETLLFNSLPEPVVAELARETTHVQMKRVGPFRLLREIARGGMGAVYLAQDPRLNRQLAVKVILKGKDATAEDIALFEREAKTMATFNHPNIVPIFEYGSDGGESWIAMPVLSGQSLQNIIRDGGPMQPRWAAAILRDVAQAIAFAHDKHILHRDLKPANIFLQTNNVPVVTDFGISRVVNEPDDHTSDTRGSRNFCAPERLRGEDGRPSDIYSLGATMYACLTGKPPHSSATNIQQQILFGSIVPPKQIDPNIDSDLNTICMKCLELEPARRYATAAELAADLTRYLKHQPIVARPASLRYRAQIAYRKNPVACWFALSAFGLLAFLLTALGFMAAQHYQRLGDQRDRFIALSLSTRDGRSLGQRFDSLSNLEAAIQVGSPLDESLQLSLRNAMIESMYLSDMKIEKSLVCESPDICAVNRDFTLYASEQPQGTLTIRRVDTQQVLGVNQVFDGRLLQIQFSENSRRLGIVTTAREPQTAHRLLIFDIDLGMQICLDESITGTAWQFLRQGAAVGFCRADGNLMEHSFVDQQQSVIVASAWANDLSYNGAEDRVAITLDNPPFVKVFEAPSGKPCLAPQHNSEVKAVAWSRDGRLLATGSRSEVRTWEMPTCILRDILKAHQSTVNALTFNNDASFLSSHAWDGRTILWDVRTGHQMLEFLGTSSMAFHPDSTCFAGVREGENFAIARLVTDDFCRLVQIPEDDDQNHRAPDRGNWSVDFLPGTHLIATAHLDGVSFIHSATSRWPLFTLPIGHCSACRFLSDGSGFITSGKSGVHYWPLRRSSTDASIIEIGWPGVISRHPAVRGHRISLDSGSKILAVLDQSRDCVHIEHLQAPALSFDLALSGHVDALALHPLARQLAVGTWRQEPAGVTLIPLSEQASRVGDSQHIFNEDAWPVFSQLGDLLLSSQHGHQAFSADGPPQGQRFSIACPAATTRGIAAFSPSHALAALSLDDRAIQIADALRGHEVATLRIREAGTPTSLAFSDDGSLLAVSYLNRRVRVWNLRDIQRYLHTQNLDWSPSLRVSELPVTNIKLLTRQDSQDFAYPPAIVQADRMPHSMEEALPVEPTQQPETNHSQPYVNGYKLAEAGQWRKAAEHFALAVKHDPERAKHWYVLALVELKQGHLKEYQQICQAMVERFSASANRQDLMYTTWTCALGDNSLANWDPVMAMADDLVASAPLDPKGHTSRNTRGLLYVRMKQYREAQDELGIAMQIHSAGGNPSDWMALSMAKHNLGDQDGALELYQQADAWIESRKPSAIPWNELLEYSLIREQTRVHLGLVASQSSP